jgi:hypothetical protein
MIKNYNESEYIGYITINCGEITTPIYAIVGTDILSVVDEIRESLMNYKNNYVVVNE